MTQVAMKRPNSIVIAGVGARGNVFPVNPDGIAYVDPDSVATLLAQGWTEPGSLNPALVTASYATDSSGNAVGLVGPGGFLLPPGLQSQRKTVSIKPAHSPSLSATAGLTRQSAFICPVSWVAYKVRVYNAYNGGAVTYKIGVTTASAIDDATDYNSNTWEIPTFGGASSVTVPAAAGAAIPEQVNSFVDSDVMFTPSLPYGNGTIAVVRVYTATANNTKFDLANGIAQTSVATQGIKNPYMLTTDAVSAPTSFVPAGNTASMTNVEIIAYTAKQVKRIAVGGSSTASGYGDTATNGWAWSAGNALSNANFAYQFSQFAHAGRTTNSGLATILTAIQNTSFDVAIYSVFSTNDADNATTAGYNRMIGQLYWFADECKKYGVRPCFMTFQGPTGMTGQTNTNRKLVNQAARDLAAAVGGLVFDVAALFTDETQATGTWKNPAYTTDGTHPNNLGEAALAVYAQTVFA